jgi:hypothetical protein
VVFLIGQDEFPESYIYFETARAARSLSGLALFDIKNAKKHGF